MSLPPTDHETLFHAAVLLPAAEQAAFLDRVCADNPALRAQVDSLLQAHAAAQDFLESAPQDLSEARLRSEASPEEKPGDRIGRYKLLQKIGEGGCGVVYMAEQEESVRRRVALKVIKLGMDTKAVIARFEAERQALARMEHPNIARVLDAGATAAGRPFFVMELVRGLRITEYCDQNNLATQQRLELFVQVCHAIQHAHQKGIIHRDIKPSNILVTLHDGLPVPKVIDFGIAKATHGRLTEQTLFTAFEQFIGTPAYVSPEQAEMSGLDVDTRSDIYSLGVLLYELLAGRTPFDTQELVAAGLDEMRRRIREQEPPRPSHRVRTLNDSDRTTVARRRGTDAPRLTLQLRGDLDWIVMRCLEKDRARRYDTANGLAMDIERHLKNEPVTARPPSTAYLFQKLVRRHQLAFAATAAIVVISAAGFAVSTSLFLRERDARERERLSLARAREAEANALREKARAEKSAANEALLRVVAEAGEKRAQSEATQRGKVAAVMTGTLRDIGRLVTSGDRARLREIIDQLAARKQDLGEQPELAAEVDEALGGHYFRMGEYQRAESLFKEALALREKVLGDRPPTPEIAQSLNYLGLVCSGQSRWQEAEDRHKDALRIQQGHFGPKHAVVAETMGTLGWVLAQQAKLEEAEHHLRLVLAMQRELHGTRHASVATALSRLGSVLTQAGRIRDGEEILREALQLNRELFGHDSLEVASALNALAVTVALDLPRLPVSIKMYHEAFVIRERLAGREAGPAAAPAADATTAIPAGPVSSLPDSGPTSLQAMLGQPGSLLHVEAVLRDAQRYAEINYGKSSWEEAFYLAISAWILIEEQKFAEAETIARQTLAIRENLRPDDWSTHHARHMVGAALAGQKRPAEAEPLLVGGYWGMKARAENMPEFHRSRVGEAVYRLIHFYRHLDRPADVAKWWDEFARLEPDQQKVLVPAPPR